MATEPEVAALYTARYFTLNEAETMRKNDCFVLCDAGGGTVDVVSYKVKQVHPTLQLQIMTIPTGRTPFRYGRSIWLTYCRCEVWLELHKQEVQRLASPYIGGEELQHLGSEGRKPDDQRACHGGRRDEGCDERF